MEETQVDQGGVVSWFVRLEVRGDSASWVSFMAYKRRILCHRRVELGWESMIPGLTQTWRGASFGPKESGGTRRSSFDFFWRRI